MARGLRRVHMKAEARIRCDAAAMQPVSISLIIVRQWLKGFLTRGSLSTRETVRAGESTLVGINGVSGARFYCPRSLPARAFGVATDVYRRLCSMAYISMDYYTNNQGDIQSTLFDGQGPPHKTLLLGQRVMRCSTTQSCPTFAGDLM